MKKQLVDISNMKYVVTYLDAMSQMRALAAFVSVDLAKQFAQVCINEMKHSQYYVDRKVPNLYVYDQKGLNYGSYSVEGD